MEGCFHGLCGKCHGGKKLVVGILLLLNAFVWPQWGVSGEVGEVVSEWIAFVAVLMVIGGVLKLFMPTCGHCRTEAMPMKGKKK